MQATPTTAASGGIKRLLLLGAGHAHVHVLAHLATHQRADLQVTVLTPHGHQTYSGMTPGLVAGCYTEADCQIPLAPLVQAYERVLQHHQFTGRSGTMFGYEGLGCIYWHMVAKLLLQMKIIHPYIHTQHKSWYGPWFAKYIMDEYKGHVLCHHVRYVLSFLSLFA